MDTAEALQFIRDNHRGVLMAYRRDGAVQSSPVAAAVDAEGRVVISSRETAFKVKHLLRDPVAAYCGFADDFFGPWVQVEGAGRDRPPAGGARAARRLLPVGGR